MPTTRQPAPYWIRVVAGSASAGISVEGVDADQAARLERHLNAWLASVWPFKGSDPDWQGEATDDKIARILDVAEAMAALPDRIAVLQILANTQTANGIRAGVVKRIKEADLRNSESRVVGRGGPMRGMGAPLVLAEPVDS